MSANNTVTLATLPIVSNIKEQRYSNDFLSFMCAKGHRTLTQYISAMPRSRTVITQDVAAAINAVLDGIEIIRTCATDEMAVSDAIGSMSIAINQLGGRFDLDE